MCEYMMTIPFWAWCALVVYGFGGLFLAYEALTAPLLTDEF